MKNEPKSATRVQGLKWSRMRWQAVLRNHQPKVNEATLNLARINAELDGLGVDGHGSDGN